MATEYGDLDSLVRGREQRGQGKGGGAYFSRWKKREPPVADVWLSCTRKPVTFYRHNFPEIVSYEKDGESVTKTFTKPVNCYEDDAVNDNRKRDKNTGKRLAPPRVCPICLLVEWVREQVLSGAWSPKTHEVEGKVVPLTEEERVGRSLVTPLFAFDAKDDEEETVITAGGFVALYSDKQPEEWTKAMKKAKLSPMDTWKENGLAKLNYLFCLVDNEDPGAGIQKAIEPNLLGDKVVDELARIRESKGAKGDVYQYPFALRLKHKPKEKQFDKKYDAFRLEDLELTDEVEALIRGPAPDISNDLALFDPKSVLARMQGHAQVKGIPWDEIFKPGIAHFESHKGGASPAPAAPQEPAKKRTRASEQETEKFSPREKMLALKVTFDQLPEGDSDPTIQCGSKQLDGSECEQKLPEDYKGDCPRCWIAKNKPEVPAEAPKRTRAQQQVPSAKSGVPDDDSEIPFDPDLTTS